MKYSGKFPQPLRIWRLGEFYRIWPLATSTQVLCTPLCRIRDCG